MYGNRPKSPTEPYIPYTSILRIARLQMSRVRINDAPPPSSPSKTSNNDTMDCEMDDLQLHGTANNLSAPSLSTAPRLSHPAATPSTKAATTSSRAIECIPNNDDTSLGAHRTPVCICPTCERAAVEAKAAAALHMQLSLASRQRLDRGSVGYAC